MVYFAMWSMLLDSWQDVGGCWQKTIFIQVMEVLVTCQEEDKVL